MNPDYLIDDYMNMTYSGGGSLWGAVSSMLGKNKDEGAYIAKKAEVSNKEYEQAKEELDLALADLLEDAANNQDISASTVLVESLNMDTTKFDNERKKALWDLHGIREEQVELIRFLTDSLSNSSYWSDALYSYSDNLDWKTKNEFRKNSTEGMEKVAQAIIETQNNLNKLSKKLNKLEAEV